MGRISGTSLRAFALLLAASALATISTAQVAQAGPTVRPAAGPIAKADWAIIPMSKDANDDGIIDGDGGFPKAGALSLQPSMTFIGAGNFQAQPNERMIDGSLSWYLDPSGYPVQLDACSSVGAHYRWTILNGATTVLTTQPRRIAKKTCRTQVMLPEGDYTFRLQVTRAGRTDNVEIPASVRNILMVVLGDSYASGEGTPRNIDAWIRQAGFLTTFMPYWDDDPCDRSAMSGPAQAALALERVSSKTSVTLVDVSCAGATVDAGVLGPQPGARKSLSQIEQVRRIIGDRAIDVASITVGGNDVGFTSILTSCSTRVDCPIQRASNGPLAAYPTLQDGAQARLGTLPAAYARIAGCLGGSACALAGPGADRPLPIAAGGAVFPTMYPDITRAASGAPCTYLTMDATDFAWARSTLLVPDPTPTYPYRTTANKDVVLAVPNGTLNSQIAATGNLGWRPVAGSWGASGDSQTGHGVCAGDQAWVFGLTALQGFPSGSFHPNPRGQQATAKAISAAVSAALGL
ncbi:MAG: hypothetical protein ACKOE2_06660 [Actinomycetales bacterium]